eukprot:g20600.t1
MSSNRYAENRAFSTPGFSNVARPFSSPRSPTDVRPNPAVMAEIVADHLELYCLQAARASKTPPYIFFQGIGIDDDDAFTQLEYFQQIVHLPILIPFPADYDFEGNARAVGHRNSTQKRLNLVLSVLEPKTFATDWALTDSSTPEEILHPYMSASCLTRKVAVKATCISLLLADGKENLARLAESYLDFTWRHISFRLDSKQYTINLGELYYCEDPALIDDPQATELKDRWLHQPKPILWFHTLESAMAIVKRINIFAPMFSDYWDSDLVPMSVRPLFVVPPRHEMLPHFAPLPRIPTVTTKHTPLSTTQTSEEDWNRVGPTDSTPQTRTLK